MAEGGGGTAQQGGGASGHHTQGTLQQQKTQQQSQIRPTSPPLSISPPAGGHAVVPHIGATSAQTQASGLSGQGITSIKRDVPRRASSGLDREQPPTVAGRGEGTRKVGVVACWCLRQV